MMTSVSACMRLMSCKRSDPEQSGSCQVQRDEIDAVCVEDGEGCTCILRGENVEILSEDLCEGRARGGIIVDDQDCGFRVACIGDKSRRHSGTCIPVPVTGQ